MVLGGSALRQLVIGVTLDLHEGALRPVLSGGVALLGALVHSGLILGGLQPGVAELHVLLLLGGGSQRVGALRQLVRLRPGQVADPLEPVGPRLKPLLPRAVGKLVGLRLERGQRTVALRHALRRLGELLAGERRPRVLLVDLEHLVGRLDSQAEGLGGRLLAGRTSDVTEGLDRRRARGAGTLQVGEHVRIHLGTQDAGGVLVRAGALHVQVTQVGAPEVLDVRLGLRLDALHGGVRPRPARRLTDRLHSVRVEQARDVRPATGVAPAAPAGCPSAAVRVGGAGSWRSCPVTCWSSRGFAAAAPAALGGPEPSASPTPPVSMAMFAAKFTTVRRAGRQLEQRLPAPVKADVCRPTFRAARQAPRRCPG